MSHIIKDGTGNGNTVKVGGQNRLHTHGLNASIEEVATMHGNSFDVFTDITTLRSADASALIYIKNNEEDDICIRSVSLALDASTGATNAARIKICINPTGGTLLTDATDANMINRRFGDSETLDVTTYQGEEGKTHTGSDCVIETITAAGVFTTNYIIPKGASVSLSVEPGTGNTSQNVRVSLQIIKSYSRYTID